MKKSDLDEKVYYDDSTTKVTASFIAGYKKIILPIDRVTDVIISHKSYSMYLCIGGCIEKVEGSPSTFSLELCINHKTVRRNFHGCGDILFFSALPVRPFACFSRESDGSFCIREVAENDQFLASDRL